jgi:hypothetical protein
MGDLWVEALESLYVTVLLLLLLPLTYDVL